ncbi:MAG TPA: ABC transporter permease [Symbiobacteriaceae bacterium]|nr:ABC transporter permease [Symbiobacteriaceae bacterium]
MWFEWFVGLRLLREGRTQTALILAGISVGVAVTVFLSALIGGLQSSLIDQTLGSQPHVTLRAGGDDPTAVFARDEAVEANVQQIPGVTAVAPVLTAPAFVRKGESAKPVVVRGAVPEQANQIVDFAGQIKAGEFRLDGGRAVIGVGLATELGVAPGDTVQFQTAGGQTREFTVAGLFDLGNKEVNQRWAVVPLTEAQALFGRANGISGIELKVADIFQAETAAAEAASRTGLTAEAWSQVNAQLLTGLKSQSSSSYLIQFFVIMAVALGIASVLVVSVVQKTKEIGILKAMGASTGRVLRIFLIQGAVLGLAGSLLGSLLGAALGWMFTSLVPGPNGGPLFPIDLTAGLFLRSILVAAGIGVLAAVAPARRAANLEPATVIRYG